MFCNFFKRRDYPSELELKKKSGQCFKSTYRQCYFMLSSFSPWAHISSGFSYCPSPILLYSPMLNFSNQEKGGLRDTSLFGKLLEGTRTVLLSIFYPTLTWPTEDTPRIPSFLKHTAKADALSFGGKGRSHIFKHDKTMFTGIYEFSPLGITGAVCTWQLKLSF